MPFIISAIIAISIFFSLSALLEQSCKDKAEKMQIEYAYKFQTGCMIKVKGRWLPLKNYRYTQEE